MGVGLLLGKCFEAKTRMRHELTSRDKPPSRPPPHLYFKTRGKIRIQAPFPRPLPPPRPTSFRPSPVQPPSSPFPVHSYFRLKCALACCPWQAWLRVRPSTNHNFSPGHHQWLNAHPLPDFAACMPIFNPKSKLCDLAPP